MTDFNDKNVNNADTDNNQVQEENKLIAERRSKLASIREKGNAFPNEFRRDDFAQKLQDDFGD